MVGTNKKRSQVMSRALLIPPQGASFRGDALWLKIDAEKMRSALTR
jgi:hypothetical protein